MAIPPIEQLDSRYETEIEQSKTAWLSFLFAMAHGVLILRRGIWVYRTCPAV
jgi:hypothetical protein